MTFLQLLQHLEQQLGHHQVPLHPGARTVYELMAGGALHHELMKQVSLALFKQNKCQKLSDPVTAATSLAALVPIRLHILRAQETDIDLFHFIEALCVAVDGYFRSHEQPSPAVPARALPQVAQVVAFKRTRLPKPRVKSLA